MECTTYTHCRVNGIGKLVLEMTGSCDRKTIRSLIERASGVRAAEIRIECHGRADLCPKALRLLAAVLRRIHSTSAIRIHGLRARDAQALHRLGVSPELLVGIRPNDLLDAARRS